MRGTLGDRRWRILAFAGGAIYALFLAIAPFEHHDLACHLKTPSHCTSCASSLVGSDPDAPAVLGAWNLADAGRAGAVQILSKGALLAVRSTGRSPPHTV